MDMFLLKRWNNTECSPCLNSLITFNCLNHNIIIYKRFSDEEQASHRVQARRHSSDNTIPRLCEQHFISRIVNVRPQRQCVVCTRNKRKKDTVYWCRNSDVGLSHQTQLLRIHKKTKFSPKHIEVSNTDAGQFQGPTCYLSVSNTETLPLSEEKKAALEAEKKGKKKKELKPGLTPKEQQKVLDEEYKEMLRATAAEEKENRKIALQRIRHEEEEFKSNAKPAWYQEFSYNQSQVTGGRATQPMPYSRKPDAHDQIQVMMDNQAPTRQSLKPDKKYPLLPWKRKKKSYCDKKKRRRPKPTLPNACGIIDCRSVSTAGKSIHEVDIKSMESTVTTELLIHKVPHLPSARLDNVTENEEEILEENIYIEISDSERMLSKNETLNENSGKKNIVDEQIDMPLILPETSEELRKKLLELISEGSNILQGETVIYEQDSYKNITQQEDAGLSNTGTKNEYDDRHSSGLLYIGLEYRDSIEMSNHYLPESNQAMKKNYPQPVFLTLKDQFPRPSWCLKDYTIQPIFSTAVCGYVPKSAQEAIEAESIPGEDSEAFLHWKCLQLPSPIPTIPTLKAVITGYWQDILYSFRAPKLTHSEVKILKTGGEEIFIILAKNALADMAENGNPLACLPNVHDLPPIKQLIRARTNFKLTEKVKDKLMLKSLSVWEKIIGQPRRTKLVDMEMQQRKWTWNHIVEFKKMKLEDEFRQKDGLMEDVMESLIISAGGIDSSDKDSSCEESHSDSELAHPLSD
ncbi:hypothetical protein C0J52_03668 [Blattella germanica]|nr:hypothetical protein C0J52_03668 [Blattella germanica]